VSLADKCWHTAHQYQVIGIGITPGAIGHAIHCEFDQNRVVCCDRYCKTLRKTFSFWFYPRSGMQCPWSPIPTRSSVMRQGIRSRVPVMRTWLPEANLIASYAVVCSSTVTVRSITPSPADDRQSADIIHQSSFLDRPSSFGCRALSFPRTVARALVLATVGHASSTAISIHSGLFRINTQSKFDPCSQEQRFPSRLQWTRSSITFHSPASLVAHASAEDCSGLGESTQEQGGSYRCSVLCRMEILILGNSSHVSCRAIPGCLWTSSRVTMP